MFDGSADGSLVKTTTAGPNDSIVSPGQTITVTLTWTKQDFGWPGPSTSEDCVEIGSRVVKLSQEHKPAPLTGTDTFSYVVPATTGGQPVCDRGVVWGYGPSGDGWSNSDGKGRGSGHGDDDRSQRVDVANSSGSGAASGHGAGPERSAVVCYTVLNAATPEVPSTILFPLVGLAVVGGGVLLARRRGAPAELEPPS